MPIERSRTPLSGLNIGIGRAALEDIRKILTSSAKHPGAKDRDDDLGSGLVDPAKALQDAGDLRSIQPAKR